MFKKMTKLDWFSLICNNFLIIIGSFLLAIGSGIFLTKLSIVSGGLTGIGIIIQHFVDFQIIDIAVAVLTIVCWFIGLFTCGKSFSFKTLLSSIVYPLFLSLILRVEYFQKIAIEVAGKGAPGNILICGLFAGVFIGGGVALTFLGKGSTGGVDVFVFLLAKHTKLKESVWSFIIDGSIIVLSMIIIPHQWINSLVGILSAFISAMMIEFIYNSNISSYQADIISNKWEDISHFAQDELGRGATIIRAEGGYKGEERIILRVVFEKRQFDKLARYIAKVDPHAFVTYTQTKAVYGEGFKSHK
ncbi:MAG: YitT family protein [Bacilli bacterium]|nr:YitT family protein [Bacilli bacterium]